MSRTGTGVREVTHGGGVAVPESRCISASAGSIPVHADAPSWASVRGPAHALQNTASARTRTVRAPSVRAHLTPTTCRAVLAPARADVPPCGSGRRRPSPLPRGLSRACASTVDERRGLFFSARDSGQGPAGHDPAQRCVRGCWRCKVRAGGMCCGGRLRCGWAIC